MCSCDTSFDCNGSGCLNKTEVVVKEETPKKKRGRPKGSKNKPKTTE